MKIENLEVGKTYNNMKELCEVLEVKYPPTTKTKEVFLKRLKEKVKIIRNKRTIKIVGFYKIGEIKEEKKCDKKYDKTLQKLILDILIQHEDKNFVLLSKSKICLLTNLVNDNFRYCQDKMPRLSNFMDVDIKNIEEFFTTTKSLLRRNVEKALNELRNKSLIYWSEVLTICQLIENEDFEGNESSPIDNIQEEKFIDENKEEQSEFYSYKKKKYTKVFRKANREEIEYIINVEKEVMDEMGFDDKRDIVLAGKWNDFFVEVKKNLLYDRNIVYYYNSYEIIINRDYILREWENLNKLKLDYKYKSKLEKIINEKVYNNIKDNALKRHKAASQKDVIDQIFESKEKVLARMFRRADESYMKNMNKLNRKLIKYDADSIKEYINAKDSCCKIVDKDFIGKFTDENEEYYDLLHNTFRKNNQNENIPF